MDEGNGPAQLGGDMKGHGGLARAGGAGEMDGIAGLQIGQGAPGDLLDKRGGDKSIAGLEPESVGGGFQPFVAGRFGVKNMHDKRRYMLWLTKAGPANQNSLNDRCFRRRSPAAPPLQSLQPVQPMQPKYPVIEAKLSWPTAAARRGYRFFLLALGD